MILEYLFVESKDSNDFNWIDHKKVALKIDNIEDSDLWIATFSMPGRNLGSASMLSDVNKYILSHFECTTLANEAAQYFNESLFPHINEFERDLRKLLYLTSNIADKVEGTENIKELEKMDLGAIFELIFADERYIKDARVAVNDRTWQFTKRELIESLSNIDENPLWNRILDYNMAPTLCSKFVLIKNYRNDVMHAHNIDFDDYKRAKTLFKSVNKELSEAIKNTLKIKTRPDISAHNNLNVSLNSILREAINSAKFLPAFSVSEVTEQLNEIAKSTDSSPTLAIAEQLSEIAKSVKSSPTPAIVEQLNKIAKSVEFSPKPAIVEQLNEIAKSVKSSPKPAIVEQLNERVRSASKLSKE